MGIEWAPSADKHGMPHEDALHAMCHALYVEQAFDAPGPPATVAPDLYIGPQRARTALLLEVRVERRRPRGLVVFHVMELRDKYKARWEASGEVKS